MVQNVEQKFTRGPRMTCLSRKLTWPRKLLRSFTVTFVHTIKGWTRFAPTAVHLPLYVSSAICLVPFQYYKMTDGQMRLKLAQGWRRVVCYILHFVALLRALCVYSLCLDGNFRWTYHEFFTADAAAYSVLSLMCSLPVIAIMFVHSFRREICELYNSLRTATERFAGNKNNTKQILVSVTESQMNGCKLCFRKILWEARPSTGL